MKILQILICFIVIQPVFALDTLTVKEVSKGMYVHFGKHEIPNQHNHGAIANIGFIVGEKCVAVIDSGANPTEGQALKQTITQITDKPICYVINTHVHPDHIYGNRAFKGKGVEFVGHYKLARAMVARHSFYVDRAAEQLGVQLNSNDLVLPTLEVQKMLKLDLGGRELKLVAHPTAHTDNDLSIYDKNTDTLWLGDLLFRQHLPVIDGSIKGWIAELERLEKNNYKHVIAGHGALVTDWKHSLQPQKRYLILLRDEIRAMIKQDKFLEEAVKSVGYSEAKKWKLFEQFHRKNITSAFAELEWEE